VKKPHDHDSLGFDAVDQPIAADQDLPHVAGNHLSHARAPFREGAERRRRFLHLPEEVRSCLR
jgi:hypothetical protein